MEAQWELLSFNSSARGMNEGMKIENELVFRFEVRKLGWDWESRWGFVKWVGIEEAG